MIHRQRALLVAGLVLAVFAARAPAQPAVPLIADEHKTQQSSPLPRKSIDITSGVVNTLTTNLIKGSPAVQKSAREQLLRETRLFDDKTEAGVPFLDEYYKQIAKALLPALKDDNARVRLNAAIVAANLAQIGSPMRLQACIDAMIAKDQKPAIILWGIKGAQAAVVWSQKMGQPNSKLLKMMMMAAQNSQDPAVIQETYKALMPSTPDALLTPELFRLMEFRRQQFIQGAVKDPEIEAAGPFSYLCTKVWRQLSPQQQLQTVQTLSDMLGLLAAQADSGNTDSLLALRDMGGCVAVLAQQIESPKLKTAATLVARLNLISPPAGLSDMAREIHDALKAIKGWEKLNPPPAAKPGPGGN